MKHVIILLFTISASTSFAEAYCGLENLARSQAYLHTPETNCTTNADCSSVKCSGNIQSKPFVVGIVLSLCTAEPSVSIIAHIPHLGIKDWGAEFHDKTEKIIPGLRFPNNGNQTSSAFVVAEVSLVNSDGEFLFSLKLKTCDTEIYSKTDCQPLNATIQNWKLSFPCNLKTNTQDELKKCQISVPFTCANNETCQQIGTSDAGVCVLLAQDETTTSHTILPTTPSSASKREAERLAVGIAVPLLFAALAASFVIVAYRKGWIRKLCRQLEERNRFEQIGGTSHLNDDDDEPLPL